MGWLPSWFQRALAADTLGGEFRLELRGGVIVVVEYFGASVMTRITLVLCLIVGGLPNGVSAQVSGLSKLGQQCQAIDRDKDAAWRTVDWQTDLIAAQQMAVEQQKPLFIWAMDGHPLGCT